MRWSECWKKSDFVLGVSFLLVDFRRGNLREASLVIVVYFSKFKEVDMSGYSPLLLNKK